MTKDYEKVSRLRPQAQAGVEALTSALGQMYSVTELVRIHMIDVLARMKKVADRQGIDAKARDEIMAIAKDSTKLRVGFWIQSDAGDCDWKSIDEPRMHVEDERGYLACLIGSDHSGKMGQL